MSSTRSEPATTSAARLPVLGNPKYTRQALTSRSGSTVAISSGLPAGPSGCQMATIGAGPPFLPTGGSATNGTPAAVPETASSRPAVIAVKVPPGRAQRSDSALGRHNAGQIRQPDSVDEPLASQRFGAAARAGPVAGGITAVPSWCDVSPTPVWPQGAAVIPQIHLELGWHRPARPRVVPRDPLRAGAAHPGQPHSVAARPRGLDPPRPPRHRRHLRRLPRGPGPAPAPATTHLALRGHDQMPDTGTVVAVAQLALTVGEPDANREAARAAIAEAALAGARLVVLPELSDSGYLLADAGEARSLASPAAASATRTGWRSQASTHDLTIAGGFCELGTDGKLYNSAAIVDASGTLAVYRKVHLWDAEKEIFTPGDSAPPVVELPFGKVGLMICYDLEFPEWVRLAALSGADLIAAPVSWAAAGSPMPPGERSGEVVAVQAAAAANGVFIAVAD